MKSRASAVYFTSFQNYTKDASSSSPSENRLPRAIYKENYKTKYLRLFTPFSNLITKESYNWWVTRRKWGFRHQISEAKYQKMSAANIWKHSGEFRRCTKWLRNFADVQDDVQDDCDWLPMTLNSSFQL